MKRSQKYRNAYLGYLFGIVMMMTIAIYILRGIGWLGFIPGGWILFLIFASLMTGIIYAIDKSKRF